MAKAHVHQPWTYRGEPFTAAPKGIEGFVYLLTVPETGKRYIGKKSFWSVSTTEVNGRKKNTKRESDWQKYYSSNLEIMALVKGGNGHRVVREILHLCKTKGTASYLEAKEIFAHECLEKPDEWYNYFIELRVNAGHLRF